MKLGRKGLIIITTGIAMILAIIALLMPMLPAYTTADQLVQAQCTSIVIYNTTPYWMLNNTIHSALKFIDKPTASPYPVVNIKVFPNTLATFALPSGYGYKYASIMIKNDEIYIYEFNNPSNYRIYTVVKIPSRS